jgi:hypothetical protein
VTGKRRSTYLHRRLLDMTDEVTGQPIIARCAILDGESTSVRVVIACWCVAVVW